MNGQKHERKPHPNHDAHRTIDVHTECVQVDQRGVCEVCAAHRVWHVCVYTNSVRMPDRGCHSVRAHAPPLTPSPASARNCDLRVWHTMEERVCVRYEPCMILYDAVHIESIWFKDS